MGWIKNAKAEMVRKDAAAAWEADSRYFTPFLNMPALNAGLSGGIPDWPPMMEAIESVGWRLHTWSVAPDAKGRPQAFPLYVRP